MVWVFTRSLVSLSDSPRRTELVPSFWCLGWFWQLVLVLFCCVSRCAPAPPPFGRSMCFTAVFFNTSHVHTAVAALGRAERALSSDVPRHAWSRLAAAATSNVDGECTGGVRCASLLRPFGQPVAQRASRHAESHVALRVSWPMQRQVCWDGQCVVAPHLRDSMLLPSR